MDNHTRISLMGLLLALSTANIPSATATSETALAQESELTPSDRVSRIVAALPVPTAENSEPTENSVDLLIGRWANVRSGGAGWRNGGGGGAWRNGGGGGGWGNGGGGAFLNSRPWTNGWLDGGGFLNRNPWRNGGFLNRW